jgi:acid phosphatase family membrane protein YuiD
MNTTSFVDALRDLGTNDILWIAILTGTLAQFLKPLTFWRRTGEFDWHHIAEAGGMPSSHSAMVSALAAGLGLEEGFGSGYFAIAVIFAMIVVYDAVGVRRAAGRHAYMINRIIAELLSGHPIHNIRLKEMLGHSYTEVTTGILFGVTIMFLWKLGVQPLFPV